MKTATPAPVQQPQHGPPAAKPLRILIADDHDLVRRGIRDLFRDRQEWEICGEAATGLEAVEKSKRLKPDIVVLDANMPQMNGAEATREIMKILPDAEVLVLTMDESPQLMRELLQAGARGYIFKSDVDRDLLAAVGSLARHFPHFTSKVAQMMLEDYQKGKSVTQPKPSSAPLTPRQMEVARLLAQGKTNKEVAVELGISVKTAETHRAIIMRRMGFHSFSDLVRYAISTHMIE